MRDVDLAYIAGLLDGEGCITLSPYKTWNRVVIEINNKNKELLIWCKNIVKLGKVYKKKAKYGYSFSLTFTSTEGKDFLKLIYPFIKLKRKQIDLLFNYWDIINTIASTKSEERKLLITSISQDIRLLNRVGITYGTQSL